ncbi:MAG: DNA/RNA non-specific endonuclease [Lachnospiraceae bacterium]
MNEISADREIVDIKSSEVEHYKEIQPEKGLSPDEARDFWDNRLNEEMDCNDGGEQENPHQKIIEGKKCYFDDNGELYRVDNDLLPNSSYEINGYHYETDEYGRIVSVKGALHMKERDNRLSIKDSIEDIGKGDQKEGDDRGHLIGDQFDGSNGLENMIPQDAEVNRNGFRNLENELAREVKDGKEVKVEINLEYKGESRRPEALIVTYSIDGEKSVRVFPNGQEE